ATSNLQATTIAGATGGSVHISNDAGIVNLLASNAGQNKTFELDTTANGSISTEDGGAVAGSGARTIHVFATGSDSINTTAGTLSATNVNLSTQPGSVRNTGTVLTATSNLQATTVAGATGGSVHISNAGGIVNLLASNAGQDKTFELDTTANGSI